MPQYVKRSIADKITLENGMINGFDDCLNPRFGLQFVKLYMVNPKIGESIVVDYFFKNYIFTGGEKEDPSFYADSQSVFFSLRYIRYSQGMYELAYDQYDCPNFVGPKFETFDRAVKAMMSIYSSVKWMPNCDYNYGKNTSYSFVLKNEHVVPFKTNGSCYLDGIVVPSVNTDHAERLAKLINVEIVNTYISINGPFSYDIDKDIPVDLNILNWDQIEIGLDLFDDSKNITQDLLSSLKLN